MGVTWHDPPTDITPGASEWNNDSFTTVDLSSHIASGATGVILRVENTQSAQRRVGVRKTGSTDSNPLDCGTNTTVYPIVGVDGSRQCGILLEDGDDPDHNVHIIAEFDSDAVFDTNATNVATGSGDTWTDVDVSSNTTGTAKAVFLEISDSSPREIAIRMNGSTDDPYLPAPGPDIDNISWFTIGVDGSEIFELNRETSATDVYLKGYITDGVTMNTNAQDITPGSNATWTQFTIDANADGAFIYVSDQSASSRTWGVRESGDTGDTRTTIMIDEVAGGAVRCDGSGRIDSYVSTTAIPDFYCVGWAGSTGTTFNDTIEEDITVGFSMTETLTVNATVSEGITPGESNAAAATFNATTSDGITVGFSLAGGLLLEESISFDLPGMGFSLVGACVFGPTISEGFTPGFSLANSMTMVESISESFTPGDSNAAAATFNPTISEGFTPGDSYSGGLLLVESVSEGITPGFSLAAVATFGAGVSEGITVGDTMVAVGTYGPILAEAIILGDSLTASNEMSATVSEGITVGDSYLDGLVFEASFSEGITPGFTVTVSNTLNLALSEDITPGYTIAASAVYEPSIIEGVTLGENYNAQATINALLSEDVTLGYTVTSVHIPAGGGDDPLKSFPLVANPATLLQRS